MTLEGWTVPETARLESVLTFELTVENTGDRAGRFLAGINTRDPYRAVSTVSRRIPPDETRVWELDADRIESWFLSDGPNEEEKQVTYRLDWSGGNDSRTVTVEPEATTVHDRPGG